MGGREGPKRERCGRGCGREGDSTWIVFFVVISGRGCWCSLDFVFFFFKSSWLFIVFGLYVFSFFLCLSYDALPIYVSISCFVDQKKVKTATL